MKFHPVYPSDFHRLESYATRQPYPLCVYSLPCILVWRNVQYHPEAAEWENLLLVAARFPEQPEKNHLILPFAPGQEPLDPERLWRLARKAGFIQYSSVPQEYLDRFPRHTVEKWFHISREKGYDDYIYRQSDLAQLPGNRYAKKRNLINQFHRDYIATGRVTLEAVQGNNIAECRAFLEEWCLQRDCSQEDNLDLACEKEAAHNMLADYAHMDVQGLVARIDGEVQAFGIGARLTARMGVLHFEKAMGSIKGLYQYFDRECARRIFAGYEYINKESDMEVPGLARAKKSYHPVYMVRAHQLRIKE